MCAFYALLKCGPKIKLNHHLPRVSPLYIKKSRRELFFSYSLTHGLFAGGVAEGGIVQVARGKTICRTKVCVFVHMKELDVDFPAVLISLHSSFLSTSCGECTWLII